MKQLGSLIAAFILASASAGFAANSPPGIDLIIVIDQSGSMWGHREFHPLANDLHGHRIGASRAVVERLVADVKNTPKVHRFSIVDFGDLVEVPWSNEVLRHDPQNPGALETKIGKELNLRIAPREMVFTNTPAALAAAAGEFRKMAVAESWSGRRRVVLLITDGRPYLRGASLELLREQARRQADELERAGAELWVLGLNDSDNYWLEKDGAFWQEVAGDPARTHLAEKPSPDLPRGIDRFVDDWLGIQCGPCSVHDPRGFDAPPYLGHLAFRVTFDSPRRADAVRILAPDGIVVPRIAPTDAANTTYARFALDDPEPSRFEFEAPSGTDITAEPHPPKVRRLAPAASVDPDVETRVIFEASLGSGKKLEILPNWQLEAKIEIQGPDGKLTHVAAEPEGQGKFAGRWQPASAGTYHLLLRGLTRIGGVDVEIFKQARGPETAVEVSSREPLFLKLERPSAAAFSTTPWADRAEVRLALVDRNGEKVVANDLIQDPGSWLVVEKIDSSGAKSGIEAPLEADGDGHFRAWLPIEPNWRRTPGLFGLGELSLRVRATPERLAASHVLRAIQLPAELETRRIQADPLSVGPIPMRLAAWLILLFGLAGFGILSLLFAGLALFWLPARRIWIRDKGKVVELRVYDLITDPAGTNASSFKVNGLRSLQVDGRVRLALGDETKVMDRLRFVREDAAGRPRGRLSYRWLGEKKMQEIHLGAGNSPKILKIEAVVSGRPVVDLIET